MWKPFENMADTDYRGEVSKDFTQADRSTTSPKNCGENLFEIWLIQITEEL